MKRLFCAIAASAVLTLPALAQGSRWKVGEPVPDLRLPTIDGSETIDLRDFRGVKLLLVEFASW